MEVVEDFSYIWVCSSRAKSQGQSNLGSTYGGFGNILLAFSIMRNCLFIQPGDSSTTYLFTKKLQRDVVFWNPMIEGYMENGQRRFQTSKNTSLIEGTTIDGSP